MGIQRGGGGGGGGGRGVWTPLKNHKSIGFLSNTDPDPLKNHKAAKPAFNNGPSLARQRKNFLDSRMDKDLYIRNCVSYKTLLFLHNYSTKCAARLTSVELPKVEIFAKTFNILSLILLLPYCTVKLLILS